MHVHKHDGNRLLRQRFAAALALALIAAACGTRATFTAAPAPSAHVIDEIIEGTGVPSAAPGLIGSSARTVFQPGSVSLKPGSGIQNGVIKVGGLFPLSGGLSALGTPPAKAAHAYFRYLNDHGGINGLKIDFDICNDKADPNDSAACTERLVNGGAFIMGPSFTPFSPNVIPILKKKGVPWIGYDGINIEGFSSKIVVTVGAPIQTMAHALLPYWYRQVEKNTGRAPKDLGVVYLDVPPAKTYLSEAQRVICPKLGCTIKSENVKRVTYSTLYEYGGFCLSFRQAQVDAVWIITDPASAVKMLVQCREARYKPPAGFLGQHGVYLDLTVEHSGAIANGMIANSALLPPSLNVPPVNEMKRIVGTYESDMDYGYFTALAYASARMTEDVIRRALTIDSKLSRLSLLQAATQMNAYDCHGLCKSVNLAPPAAQHGGNHNVWMVRARRDEGAPSQWLLDGGPVDAWQSETWPRPGRP
jgi:branched-chain amino acid transport system substrate-binding protein